MAARLGGDEFAVMLSGPVSSSEAEVIAWRIRDALSEPINDGRLEVSVGASVGVAHEFRSQGDAGALLHAADVALYGAKREGRGTVRSADTYAE